MEVLWALESVPGETLFWNSTYRRFEYRGSESIGDEAVRTLLNRVENGLEEELATKDNINDFEIRLAYAVRK